MTVVSMRKMAFKLVQDRLVVFGFQKRRAGIFSCPILDEVIGWIGLNTATRGRSDALEINPVVGVRNQRIERLVAELTGDAFDDLIPPTIAGNVGYLSPARRYLAYTFAESASNEEVADRLCESIKMYGLPFMKKIADLRTMIKKMQTLRFGMAEQLHYRIPIGLWLLNEIEEAETAIATRLHTIGERSDPAALRYLSFAKELSELMRR